MASFYQAADVVVCRAGASTVAELGRRRGARRPRPPARRPGRPQTANARVLDRRRWCGGRARRPSAPARDWPTEIDALRSPPERLGPMREAAASLGHPDAVAAVVSLVETHARLGPRPPGSVGAATRARPGSA